MRILLWTLLLVPTAALWRPRPSLSSAPTFVKKQQELHKKPAGMTVVMKKEEEGNNKATTMARGGSSTNGGFLSTLLSKANAIKVHAWVYLYWGATLWLESFGVSFPVIGFPSIFKDFAPVSEFTKGLLRLAGTYSFFGFLAEKQYAEDPEMSKIYDIYHVPLGLTGVSMALQASANPIGAVICLCPTTFWLWGLVAS